MLRRGFWLSLLVSLLGCSPLRLGILVQRDGAQALLRSTEVLIPGERFALQLGLRADSYVYVVRSISDGGTQSLYPLLQPVLVRAGTVRIPADGSQITLSPFQSGDRLCLVLSRNPIRGPLPSCPKEDASSASREGSEGKPDKESDKQSEGSEGKPDKESDKQSKDDQGSHLGKGQRPGDDGTIILPIRVAPCAPADGARPQRRALLIGIDRYLPAVTGTPRVSDLRGASHDVQAMRAVLRARYGWSDRELCVLRDGQATRAGILQSIRSFLVETARPGDQVLFFFAGHGSTVANPRSEEADRQDETLVAADANLGARDVLDKELGQLFNQILDRGSQLVAIFDSCHSGSVTMSATPSAQGVMSGAPRLRYAPPATVAPPMDARAETVPPQARGAVILTATQSFQSAQELPIGGVERGLFTAALVRTLLSHPIEQPLDGLIQSVQGYMREWAREAPQVPGLETVAARRRKPLFGDRESDGIYVAVSRNTERGVLLQGGHDLGLGPGAELERVAAPPLRLRVVEVRDISTSLATVSAGEAAALRPGDLFRLRSYGRSAHASLRLWLGAPDRPLDSVRYAALRAALAQVGAVTLTADADSADYVLVGAPGERPQYSFVQPTAPTPPGPMPSRTEWSDAQDLPHQAAKLYRQYTWLKLQDPPDSATGFPYRMWLVNERSGQPLAPDGRTRDGERYFLRLATPAGTRPQPVEKRYVYLCIASNRGELALLYPAPGGNQENYLPSQPLWIEQIDLSADARFVTRGPASIDTYLLLSSTQPLANAGQACSSSMSLATCPAPGAVGAELCQLFEGIEKPFVPASVPAAARWSIQRLQVHHEP